MDVQMYNRIILLDKNSKLQPFIVLRTVYTSKQEYYFTYPVFEITKLELRISDHP